jgi:hypothetical protein
MTFSAPRPVGPAPITQIRFFRASVSACLSVSMLGSVEKQSVLSHLTCYLPHTRQEVHWDQDLRSMSSNQEYHDALGSQLRRPDYKACRRSWQ